MPIHTTSPSSTRCSRIRSTRSSAGSRSSSHSSPRPTIAWPRSAWRVLDSRYGYTYIHTHLMIRTGWSYDAHVPNRTIYVSDDDQPLYQRAQELAGGNLSGAISTALKRYVESEDA